MAENRFEISWDEDEEKNPGDVYWHRPFYVVMAKDLPEALQHFCSTRHVNGGMVTIITPENRVLRAEVRIVERREFTFVK